MGQEESTPNADGAMTEQSDVATSDSSEAQAAEMTKESTGSNLVQDSSRDSKDYMRDSGIPDIMQGSCDDGDFFEATSAFAHDAEASLASGRDDAMPVDCVVQDRDALIESVTDEGLECGDGAAVAEQRGCIDGVTTLSEHSSGLDDGNCVQSACESAHVHHGSSVLEAAGDPVESAPPVEDPIDQVLRRDNDSPDVSLAGQEEAARELKQRLIAEGDLTDGSGCLEAVGRIPVDEDVRPGTTAQPASDDIPAVAVEPPLALGQTEEEAPPSSCNALMDEMENIVAQLQELDDVASSVLMQNSFHEEMLLSGMHTSVTLEDDAVLEDAPADDVSAADSDSAAHLN